MNSPKPISQAKEDFYSQGVKQLLDPKNAIEKEITEIQNLLKNQELNENARMPERVFQFVFLPLFAGDADWPYKGKADLGMWINFAGNAFKPVDVINPEGKVLFTVPAVMDRSGVAPVKDSKELRGQRIRGVLKNAELMSHVSPRDSQKYLTDQLLRRTMIQQNTPSVINNIHIWNEIFKRYGREPIMALEENTQPLHGVEDKSAQDPLRGLDEGEWDPA